MDVLEGGVRPGTRGGQTCRDFRTISSVNLPLTVPYGHEPVPEPLGSQEKNGNGFPKSISGPGNAVDVLEGGGRPGTRGEQTRRDFWTITSCYKING